MSRRRAMTLTVLGLSLRDEILVKSLLNVVSSNTQAEWSFTDEMDADLVLYDPQSPFARTTIQKFQHSGRPSCVALLYGNESKDVSSAPMPRSIRAPLRVGEFMELLDATSDTGRKPSTPVMASTREDRMTAGGSAGLPEEALSSISISSQQWLTDVLQALIADSDASRSKALWRVEIDGCSLELLLPEKRFVLRDTKMTIDALVELALRVRVDSVLRLNRTLSDTSSRTGSIGKPVDALLWRIGLRMMPAPDAPWLQDDVTVRLKRWPDFGHLGAQKIHLAFTAYLTKSSWRIDALLETSGQSRSELHAFLGACGLIGLLDITPAPPSTTAAPIAARRLGVSGLFRSLRNALRMGA